jgi:hypothetical protein
MPPPQECVGDTAIFSMNPSERSMYAGLLWQSHTDVRTTHSPGTDPTAHSLPSAVIDKEEITH